MSDQPTTRNLKGMLTEPGYVIAAFVLNFVPSILIPTVFAYYQWISSSEGILLGFIIWILLTCGEALYKLNTISAQQSRQAEIWTIESNFEAKLLTIREAQHKILEGRRRDPDLFVEFFEERVRELQDLIRDAADRDQLSVQRGHLINTDILFRGFNGGPRDSLRAVHLFQDNDWFFGIFSRQYFYRAFELLQSKKIREIRRLMLYSDESELEDPRSVKLMKFHGSTPHYDYRVMSITAFHEIVRDFNAKLAIPRDFGVYGDFIAYVGTSYRQDNVTGFYVRSPANVASYTSLFEACWNSPVAVRIKRADAYPAVSLEQLFDPLERPSSASSS